MQIEDITSSLKQRGAVWQAIGFAVVGTATAATLWVYSDSDHWIVGTYRLAATQINWAYFGIIALAIEGVRIVFQKATEIRRRYSARADAKAEAKGLVRGREEGFDQGREEGRELGREEGFDQGREEGRELGREEGERETLARVRSEMLKRGIHLTEEDEEAIFNRNGHKD